MMTQEESTGTVEPNVPDISEVEAVPNTPETNAANANPESPGALEDDLAASDGGSPADADLEGVGEAEPGVSVSMLSELDESLALARAAESEAKDEVLRVQADIQNLRRRSERDVENAHKFALEKFATDLLPVYDSLERGLESVPENDEHQKAAREGLVLTHKLFVDTLKRFNLEVVDPANESFNPEFHEAISMQPSDEVAPNHVINVFQKGFKLNGRLIRPAMVVVAKSASGG